MFKKLFVVLIMLALFVPFAFAQQPMMNGIDLSDPQNNPTEIKDARLHNSATAPVNAATGSIWMKSDGSQFMVYDGSAWQRYVRAGEAAQFSALDVTGAITTAGNVSMTGGSSPVLSIDGTTNAYILMRDSNASVDDKFTQFINDSDLTYLKALTDAGAVEAIMMQWDHSTHDVSIPNGDLTVSGSGSFGGATIGNAKLKVKEGASGATPSTLADIAVFETNGSDGISILSPDSTYTYFMMGGATSPAENYMAVYGHPTSPIWLWYINGSQFFSADGNGDVALANDLTVSGSVSSTTYTMGSTGAQRVIDFNSNVGNHLIGYNWGGYGANTITIREFGDIIFDTGSTSSESMKISSTGNLTVSGTGNFTGALTAASYNDNTPDSLLTPYEAAMAILKVKGKDGEIDHDTLPSEAHKIVDVTDYFFDIKIDGVTVETIEGRYSPEIVDVTQEIPAVEYTAEEALEPNYSIVQTTKIAKIKTLPAQLTKAGTIISPTRIVYATESVVDGKKLKPGIQFVDGKFIKPAKIEKTGMRDKRLEQIAKKHGVEVADIKIVDRTEVEQESRRDLGMMISIECKALQYVIANSNANKEDIDRMNTLLESLISDVNKITSISARVAALEAEIGIK